MSTVTKDTNVPTSALVAGTRPGGTSARPEDAAAARPQPVALEVPVTVNGARTVDGSDKREPFSETTKTVLVFGNGAVIRLTSTVAAGQLLFLTNEKTKKEVVCQVVKSKNYRSVSGYVELEFTESVVGFWGMRFPGDRIGSQPVATNPAATPVVSLAPPPAPKIEARIPVAPLQVEARPAAPAVVKSFEHLKPQMPAAKIEIPAPITASKSQAPPMPTEGNVITIPSLPKVQTPAPVQAAPATPQNTSSDLKLETARLQEQLSAMLFADTAAQPRPASSIHSVPAIKTPIADSAAAIFEIAKSEPAPVAKASVAVPKPAVPQTKSTLDDEEVQIPSWLQPLVRNAAAATEPIAAPEPVNEEPTRLVEINEFESHEAAAAPAVAQASAPSSTASAAPAFGGMLFEESPLSEAPSAKSGKGVLYAALAAAVLLCVAGGAWYLRTSLNPGGSSTVPVNRPAEVAAAVPAPMQPTSANHLPAAGASGAGVVPGQRGSAASPAVTQQQQPQVVPASSKTNDVAPTQHPVTAPTQPETKKPSLGAVHLAAPTVSHKSNVADSAAPAFGLSGNEMAANPDALGGAGLVAGHGNQPAAPAAPIAVGGDVKTARPLSSARPVYPTIARSQHVEGDVKIDALIDPTGRVTTMKVLSGPTLLQQAAMDALRQWKYQPATLDGKTVAMHLTVTIQFRLQ